MKPFQLGILALVATFLFIFGAATVQQRQTIHASLSAASKEAKAKKRILILNTPDFHCPHCDKAKAQIKTWIKEGKLGAYSVAFVKSKTFDKTYNLKRFYPSVHVWKMIDGKWKIEKTLYGWDPKQVKAILVDK